MTATLYALALISGIVLTLQIGLNAAVRTALNQDAALAALASFVTGTLGLGAFLLLMRVSWPTRAALAGVPAWGWAGGLLGAFYVVTATFVGPRLGAGAFLSVVVLGQLSASLLVDHYGWLGFAQHSISLTRIVGAALLIAGVLLMTR
jgi:transporter family-2 protein